MLAVESPSLKPLLLAGLALTVACSGAKSETEPPEPLKACSRQWTEASPVLVAAEEVELPLSSVSVTGEVTKQQVLNQLAMQIPDTLAHENRRPIGTPGEVTYTVTRGSMDSTLRDGTFAVTTLAKAEIEVCKPLGPFCVTYGRCQPVLATTVALPLSLTDDYAWKPLSTSVRAERGCQIAGFDVTPRLTSLAKQNLDGIERRIARSLPPIKPWATRVWELAHNPLFLNASECLRATPKRFVQAPARETQSGYKLALGVDLTLELTTDCERDESPAPLEPLATQSALNPRPGFLLAQSIDTKTVSAQLTESAGGAFGSGESIRSIVAHTSSTGQANELLLEVTLDGVTCGTTWLRVELGPAESDAMKPTRVEFVAEHPPEAFADLPGALRNKGLVRAPFAFEKVSERLNQLLESALSFADENMLLTARVGAPSLRAPQIAPKGVRAIAALPTELSVTLKQGTDSAAVP